MPELATARGDGLDVGLTVTEDNDGRRRSLIYLEPTGTNVFIAVDNIEALVLAHELIVLAGINEDSSPNSAGPDSAMTASEALEVSFLSRGME